MSHSYTRLLPFCISSCCIFEDCTCVLDSFEDVYNGKGVILYQHGKMKGKREMRKEEDGKEKEEDKEKKDFIPFNNLHPVVANV